MLNMVISHMFTWELRADKHTSLEMQKENKPLFFVVQCLGLGSELTKDS